MVSKGDPWGCALDVRAPRGFKRVTHIRVRLSPWHLAKMRCALVVLLFLADVGSQDMQASSPLREADIRLCATRGHDQHFAARPENLHFMDGARSLLHQLNASCLNTVPDEWPVSPVLLLPCQSDWEVMEALIAPLIAQRHEQSRGGSPWL